MVEVLVLVLILILVILTASVVALTVRHVMMMKHCLIAGIVIDVMKGLAVILLTVLIAVEVK